MRARKSSFAVHAASESPGGLAMHRERVPITYRRLSRMKLGAESTTRTPQARGVMPGLRVPHPITRNTSGLDEVWRAGVDESSICRRHTDLPPRPAITRPGVEASVITFGASHNVAGGMTSIAVCSSPAVPPPSRAACPSNPILPLTPSAPLTPKQPCTNRVSTQLEIEGTRTGEELVLDANVHRRVAAAAGGGEEAQLAALRRRIAQLQTENRLLVDKLRRRRAECQDARALDALALQESEARLGLIVHDSHQREASLLSLIRDAVRCASRLASSQAAAERQLQEIRLKLAERSEELTRALAAAKVEAEASHTHAQATQSVALSALATELATVRAQLEALSVQSAQDKERLERDRAELQHMLLQHAQMIETLQAKAARDEYLVAQSRLFVKNVCQPNFSVVKDDSLVPVDSDRTTPSGFVLVPLAVLLHGYAILPEDERYEVIAMYETKAKQLS